MAQTKNQIQQLLATAGASPRKRFGQNFMIDANLVRAVAAAGELVPDDLVIEIGPGTGTLSEEIRASGARLLAVEIDRDLARLLRDKFQDDARFTLLEGDALDGKHALNRDLLAHIQSAMQEGRRVKLVANLPYNIASPLVIELLSAGVELLSFTVQKEVGLRLCASPGSAEYGALSVMGQLLAEVGILRKLPAAAFWPAPSIESALVRMRRKGGLGQEAGEIGRFVTQLFSMRRKMIHKSLAMMGYEPEGMLASAQIEPSRRVEELPPESLLSLFRAGRLLNGAN